LIVKILIAVPVFNERNYVASVLKKIRSIHPDVLVIDDGSTDGTAEILDACADRGEIKVIRHPENRGYGQSLIDAFSFASRRGFDWVITMDCDEQHEPEMIPQFIEQIKTDRWDIVSGSRYLRPDAKDDPAPADRRSINATLTSLLNGLFHLNLTDSFCGFKAHRVSAMQSLQLDIPGYAFPMQLWPQAVGAGLRICETPVRLIYKDPNRHFGGALDDPSNRLRHYLKVLVDELEMPVPEEAVESESCCHA